MQLGPLAVLTLTRQLQSAWLPSVNSRGRVVPIYILGQMIGAFLGGVIVWLAYRQHFEATENADLKLAVFCTGPAIRSYGSNLLTEIIGTFTLVFGVLSMTYFAGQRQPGLARRHLGNLDCRDPGLGNRYVTRWSHWLRHQSGSRSRTSHCPCNIANSGQT